MANEGVNYYPPLAAEVPVADHTAAKIIASGDIAGSFTRGLAAFGQIAAASKRAQLESEQMATDAALKSRQLDIARENNLLDFKVGMKNAEALSNYRDTMAGINSDPSNPLGLAGRVNLAREKVRTFSDFNKQAADLGLFEPNPKNPVDYYLKYRRLNDEFAFADDMPEIKNALAEFKARTEQHAIPLREGMKFDPKTKTWTAAGETRKIPIGDIVDRMHDPDQQEATLGLLQRNGFATEEVKKVFMPDERKPFAQRDYVRDWLFGGRTTVKNTTLNPSLAKYMEMGKGADFSRGKPRTPAAGVVDSSNGDLPTGVTQGQVDEASATMANESNPPPATEFPPTETEKIVAQAKRAAAKPGANIDGIKAMLQSKGIDPNLLDSSSE